MKAGEIYKMTEKSLDGMAVDHANNLTAQIAGSLSMIAINLAFIGDVLREIAEHRK